MESLEFGFHGGEEISNGKDAAEMVIESPDDQKLEAGTGTQQLQNFYQLQPQFLNRKEEHCGMETFGENEINTGQINAQQ